MIRSIFRLYISVSGPTRPRRETRDRSKDLSKALTALAPDIDPGEAQLLSAAAHTTARSLAREYHVVLNPEFQAFLVNVGLRKRGWCGHWARDIGARLKELKTLVLHWGVAYDHTSSEGSWLIRRVQPKSILVRRGGQQAGSSRGKFRASPARAVLRRKLLLLSVSTVTIWTRVAYTILLSRAPLGCRIFFTIRPALLEHVPTQDVIL